MDLGLKGKVAVITGGSSGIGAGTAKVLAAEGCNVVINYLSSKEKAEKVANEIMSEYGVETLCVKADVGNEDEVVNLFNQAVERFGTVDILLNNPAYLQLDKGPFETFKLEDLRAQERVCIEGMFIASRELIKICTSQKKGGHIVNVLTKSMFWSSSTFNEVYASCKGAAHAFTRALAHEVAADGIYVNAIVPGYCATSMYDPNSERVKATNKLLPLGRYSTPEEMGYTVAYLCSDKAQQINGATIDCTGGTLLGDPVNRHEVDYSGYFGKKV